MTSLTTHPDKSIPVAASAMGLKIFDESGCEYWDAASGAIACNIGHNNKHVLNEAIRQLRRLDFSYRAQFLNAPIDRLSKRLCSILDMGAAFFVNSGSEAVEVAIRLAQDHWKLQDRPSKTKIFSRTISYHGSTFATLSLSGHGPRRRAYGGSLPHKPSVRTPYPARDEESSLECYAEQCARNFETQLLNEGPNSVAALVVEPIVGASGAAIVPPDGYLQALQHICRKYDVLLICDEVLTGLGRTGSWLASWHWGVQPDILCLGKGLNAGYFPISAVLISTQVQATRQEKGCGVQLGHTHSNHPLGGAIANAVLDVLQSEKLIERTAKLSGFVKERLLAATDGIDEVFDVRGSGLLWGIELADGKTGAPFDPSFNMTGQVVANAFEAGLIVYPAHGFVDGIAGDAIIFAPPLTTENEQLDHMITQLGKILKTFFEA